MLKQIFYLLVVVLVMWTGASLAMAETIPPSPVTATDWKGILSVLGVALGGLGIFCSGIAKVLHAVAPLTKTTLDDRAAAGLDKVAEVIYEVRDHVLGLVRLASGPQPAPAQETSKSPTGPQPALAVVPPRNNQAGKARVRLLVLLALVFGIPVAALIEVHLSGCATAKADLKTAGHEVVVCAKADGLAIALVVADLGRQAALDALGKGSIDWSGLEDAAWTQGKVIGGCALTQFVESFRKAPQTPSAVAALMAPADPAADGQAALERLRARFGGVEWQLGGVQ